MNRTFHFIELPKELEYWRIPQMVIQTFVENEFKHAVSTDYVLTILIRISKKSYKDEEMLVIEIEDDGRGYPQDVMDYMNDNSTYCEDTGSRIGLWSVKNMLELMYERNDLIEIYNTEPHGGKSRIYIPEEPVREIKENGKLKE